MSPALCPSLRRLTYWWWMWWCINERMFFICVGLQGGAVEALVHVRQCSSVVGWGRDGMGKGVGMIYICSLYLSTHWLIPAYVTHCFNKVLSDLCYKYIISNISLIFFLSLSSHCLRNLYLWKLNQTLASIRMPFVYACQITFYAVAWSIVSKCVYLTAMVSVHHPPLL